MKVRSVCLVACAAVGLVGCGASGSEGSDTDPAASIEAGRKPPGEIVEATSKVTVSGPLGDLTFVDVGGSAFTVGNGKLEMINAVQEAVTKQGKTPLEAYLALAPKDATTPEFLLKDHQRRTARAPEALTLPTIAPSLRSQSLRGDYTDTCTLANLTATANVGVPSFWREKAIVGPSSTDPTFFTVGAIESYMYLACPIGGTPSTGDFFIKSSSMAEWMHLPQTVNPGHVAYMIHATAWTGDGLGEPGNPLDLWATMFPSGVVTVLGRAGPAQP